MPSARTKQTPSGSRRRGQSRLELAAVAIRLFDQKGFEATTVEEIAEEADYSPRTFFRQFSRKEDVLFFDLPDMAMPLRRLAEREPRGSAWDAVRAIMVENSMRWEEADPEFARARTRLFHEEPALDRRFLEISAEWEVLVARIFAAERGVDAATDVYCQTIATGMVGACRTAFRLWLAGAAGSVAGQLDSALDVVSAGRAD